VASGTPFVASLGKRVFAEAFDLIFIGAAGAYVVTCVLDYKLNEKWLFLLLPLTYVAYHTSFLLAWSGQTLGRKLCNIQIVSTKRGGDLSQLQCLARPIVRMATLMPVVFVVMTYKMRMALPFVAIDVFLITFLPSQQSLPDLICHTVVVNSPPVQPHRAVAGPLYSATDAEFGVPPRKQK
jgi:uncharacterized RDD family membrane protein YckC